MIYDVDDFIQMTTGQAGTQAEFRIYGDESSLPRIFTELHLIYRSSASRCTHN